MILARLTFEAMLPVVEQCGSTALVHPALRGLPWLDLWLRDARGLPNSIPAPCSKRLTAPCIPNRFLARYDKKSAGNWQAKVELSARLMKAVRAVR